jgi:hypothetical protein
MSEPCDKETLSELAANLYSTHLDRLKEINREPELAKKHPPVAG